MRLFFAFTLVALGLIWITLVGAWAQTPARPRPAAPQGPVFTGDLVEDAKNKFHGDPATGVQLTGNLKKDAQALWDKIQGAALVDLQYASAMAGATNTNGGRFVSSVGCDHRYQPEGQRRGVEERRWLAHFKARSPSLTDVETAAEVLDDLSPQGKLFTSCAGAAALAQANVYNSSQPRSLEWQGWPSYL